MYRCQTAAQGQPSAISTCLSTHLKALSRQNSALGRMADAPNTDWVGRQLGPLKGAPKLIGQNVKQAIYRPTAQAAYMGDSHQILNEKQHQI